MKTTGIRQKQRFYNVAVGWGVDLKNFDPDRINFESAKPKSTFKSRAQQIKQMFNHEFNFK